MNSARNQRIVPPRLQRGDTIGIAAPASNVNLEALDRGCESLRRMGYKPFYFESILEQDLYFAGSVQRRTRELERLFEAPEVKAIICARGGYGSNYLLGALDLAKVRNNPKIFVGYSDNTTLLTHFADAANMVVFHGPMLSKDFANPEGVEMTSWEAATSARDHWQLALNPGVTGLADGAARGILYGGCLSMLAATLGTPYEIQTDGKILFIEDVGAKPYQIDRMLMQMKIAGKLDSVRGIVFGEMLDCIQVKDQAYTLQEVVQRVVAPLGVPVAYGLRSGHVSQQNITLPIGVEAELRVAGTDVSLRILEPATLHLTAAASDQTREKSVRA